MKHSSRVWRYQQHMLTVKAISYYSVVMCGTSHAEDCEVRWMMAVADFCGGAASVGRIALQLAFWKASLKLWFLCSRFVSCILYDTSQLKSSPEALDHHHIVCKNIIHTFWEVFNNAVVVSGNQWITEEPPRTKIIPQWTSLEVNDKKKKTAKVFFPCVKVIPCVL